MTKFYKPFLLLTIFGTIAAFLSIRIWKNPSKSSQLPTMYTIYYTTNYMSNNN